MGRNKTFPGGEESTAINKAFQKFFDILETKETDKGNVALFSETGDAEISEKLDREYADAVKRGDTKTAQKMVENAAKRAGYTIKAYHGTNAEFYVFAPSKFGLFDNGSKFRIAGVDANGKLILKPSNEKNEEIPDELDATVRLHVKRVYEKYDHNLTRTAEALKAARNTVKKYLED